MLGTILAYVAMVVAQTQGGKIIEALHGSEVAEKALSQLSAEAVQADLSVRELCQGYAAAHFDVTSNILHASAMVATLWLFVYSVTLLFFGFFQPKNFLLLPPLYYLPAWVGHFIFQKDIPAVFTYGTTPRGLLAGEYCAFEDLFTGGIARNPQEMLYSGILLVGWIAFLFTFGGIWPAPKSTKSKAKMS